MIDGLEWAASDRWPWLLGGVALVALAMLFRARGRRSVRDAGAQFVVRPASLSLRTVRLTLLALLVGLAAMDPRYGEVQVETERRGLDLILCLDTSRSMLATDLEPTRLQRAKDDIRAVRAELVGRDRAALIAFAGDSRLVCPPTDDLDSLDALLERVDTATVRRGGTNLQSALETASALVDDDNAKSTVVILLTDGEDLAGQGLGAARGLADRGVVLHAVGYGSELGSKITIQTEQGEAFVTDENGNDVISKLDADGLRGLVRTGGGEYLGAGQLAAPLVELYRSRLSELEGRRFESGEETVGRPRFQIPLLLALLTLMLELWFTRRRTSS